MEKHVVIGAGPAGLTASWLLVKQDKPVLVLEADPTYVGGLARTVVYKDYRFDIGGHRFFSKSTVINKLWQQMLPNDFIDVGRLSRIYYDSHFFPYPLDMKATITGLGVWRSGMIFLSYLYARIRPRKPERSFEDWIINRFGYQLYMTFFKTYTEKVWGIPCSEISKDWAAQRIRGLSLLGAVKNALMPARLKGDVKTLINTFRYPRLGPGQMWEEVRDRIVERGNTIELGKTVAKLNHADGVMTSVETEDGTVYEGSHFYPTLTLRDFITRLDPPPPQEVLDAANALNYRDFLIVSLIIDRAEIFPDNWIYIHDPGVNVGRIQNFKNWSPEMVPDPTKTCLGMEYFCTRGDKIFSMDDDDLVQLAAREFEAIGFGKSSECVDGCVVRMTNAYPVYADNHEEHRQTIKAWLNGYFKNVYPAGRGGLHMYNNQDHSMMAAILSVQNVIDDAGFDVWAINSDAEYVEEGHTAAEVEERLVPKALS